MSLLYATYVMPGFFFGPIFGNLDQLELPVFWVFWKIPWVFWKIPWVFGKFHEFLGIFLGIFGAQSFLNKEIAYFWAKNVKFIKKCPILPNICNFNCRIFEFFLKFQLEFFWKLLEFEFFRAWVFLKKAKKSLRTLFNLTLPRWNVFYLPDR